MNLRILKKHCKRAMEILIADHGYRLEQFFAADGDESIDAPVSLEPRFVRNGFLDPGPLKGTPLLSVRVSYEYDEWDCLLPTDRLSAS